MPNEFNYSSDEILSIQSRPERISDFEKKAMTLEIRPVVFGLTSNDCIEIHLYDELDNLVNSAVYYAADPSITTSVVLNDLGQTAFLNLNLANMLSGMDVIPGRYTAVLNFFRDEVGSENGERLYIETISNSRTELRLKSISKAPAVQHDIYEFVTPSTPRIFSQAIVNDILGQSLSPEAVKLTAESVLDEMGLAVINEIDYIPGGTANIKAFINAALPRINKKTVNFLATKGDRQIQEPELKGFLFKAIEDSIREMVGEGQLDSRFRLV